MNFRSEYDMATGELTGRHHYCSRAGYVPPAREGKGWIEGRHDHTTHRVDLATGAVVAREV